MYIKKNIYIYIDLLLVALIIKGMFLEALLFCKLGS